MNRIAVIGAGSWGTTVAAMSARTTDTVLWARRAELADTINRTRTNPEYLDGFELPDRLEATSDLAEAATRIDALVMAVPSHGFRRVFEGIASHLGPSLPIVSLTKGIEQDTLSHMTEAVGGVAPERS